jgi:hypothetical protein
MNPRGNPVSPLIFGGLLPAKLAARASVRTNVTGKPAKPIDRGIDARVSPEFRNHINNNTLCSR